MSVKISYKKLSYRKETARMLHNQGLTLKPYRADRPISIKSRSYTDFQTRHNGEVDVYRAGAYE